jgi:hypothetical protein
MRAFISYKGEDDAHNEWVKKLATDLRKAGIEADLDVWEVHYGDSFTDYMTSRIKEADVVLFIMTTASVEAIEAPKGKGGAVKFEMQMATARRTAGENMRLIGIYREGNKTATHLRDHRYADFRDDSRYEENLRALVDDLLGKVSAPPVNQPIPHLRVLEQDIRTSQKLAEMVLSDTIEDFNGLTQRFRKSKAIKKAKKFLADFRFRFDGQFTVIDSDRNIVFHDVEGAIGLPYSQFLSEFDEIFTEYVVEKDSGIINWVDFLSSNYTLIDNLRSAGSQGVNWIRFNTSPFSYFEPWDWYIIVEAHHEIHGLKSNDITSFIDYFLNHGWLIVETPYILTSRIPAELQQELLQALQSTNKYVRRIAIRTLGRIGEPAKAVVPALIELLGDEDKKVRESIVWALGKIGDEMAVAALIEVLKDEDKRVRVSTVEALRGIGTSEALKAVEKYEKESQAVTNRVMSDNP